MTQDTSSKLSPLSLIQERLGARFSELAGWRIPEAYSDTASEKNAAENALVLVDDTPNGKLTVEGNDAGYVLKTVLKVHATGIGEGEAIPEGMVYRLRSDHYFISTSPGSESDIRKRLAEGSGPRFVTVTDMTHGWSEIRVLGAASPELMAKVCGLDLGDFPSGTARQTSVAKTNQLVVRTLVGEMHAFSLLGARSLAAYLWEVLMEAGEEWGMIPAGNKAIRELVAKGE